MTQRFGAGVIAERWPSMWRFDVSFRQDCVCSTHTQATVLTMDEGLIRELVCAEFVSANNERTRGKSAQQQTLAWSVAAIGVLFGIGIGYAMPKTPTSDALPGIAIFGLVLPLVVTASLFVWTGELLAVERVVIFLQKFENVFLPEDSAGGDCERRIGRFPVFENFIHFGRAGRGYQQRIGYVGAVIMYAGSFIATLAIAIFIVYEHSFAHHEVLFRALFFVGWTLLAIVVVVVALLVWHRLESNTNVRPHG